MLRSLNQIEHYRISATDGDIGHVRDFYFDDESWVVRYLVVDTGSWLTGRSVLISPIAIGRADWTDRHLPVALSKDQVRNSPDIDTQRPVSRQMETGYLQYYGYQSYWGGSGLWWGGIYPNTGYGYGGSGAEWLPREPGRAMTATYARDSATRPVGDDVHLRSCKAVTGYHIHANDGDIGHVDGFLFDEDTWAIQFLVVNTSNWWVGHHVLVAPEWIEHIDWADASVMLGVSRAEVQSAPPYVAGASIDRADEPSVFAHYGRQGFWKTPTQRPLA